MTSLRSARFNDKHNIWILDDGNYIIDRTSEIVYAMLIDDQISTLTEADKLYLFKIGIKHDDKLIFHLYPRDSILNRQVDIDHSKILYCD